MDELVVHLQNQFLPGMSWENYGEWHVDHRRPVDSFTFEDLERDLRECWHYSNLQPLWAYDNLVKGTKWDGVI